MKWNIKLGRYFGIDVYLHATFLLLLALIGTAGGVQSGFIGALDAVLFFSALFGCVLLHEFGHALAARGFGISTRDIILLPIGGVARLERMPEKPSQEFWVAVAGPAVNIAIAAVLWVLLWLGNGAQAPELSVMSGGFLERLLSANIFLVLFNMLPAFPMDGGRVLRAGLASVMDYARATRIAARIGQAFAFGLGLIGFFVNPLLLLVAFFVWMGAAQEAAAAKHRNTMRTSLVRHAMFTDFETLQKSDTLGRAAYLLLNGTQRDFPVVSGPELVGLLSRARLLEALAQHGEHAKVGDHFTHEIEWADPDERLEDTLVRFAERQTPFIPVLARGRLVGLLDAENVEDMLSIRSAIERHASMRNSLQCGVGRSRFA